MKSNLVVILLLCSINGVATAQTTPNEKPAGAVVGSAAKQIGIDLKEARELLPKVSDKGVRDRLELLITRSELKAIEIEKMAGALGAAQVAVSGLSAEDFAKLLKATKAEAFDEGKANLITSFAVKGRLTCDQARELLKTFSFDEGRVRAAIALYPSLTDPQKFFTVLEVFTFESGRNTVREKLKLNSR